MDMRVRHYLEMSGTVDTDAGEPSGGNDSCAELRDCLEANYTRLHRRLQRYLGCPDKAAESLHDAWLRLSDMALPPTVHAPEAYVYRIACNLAMDRLRSCRPAQYASDTDAEIGIAADPSPGPDVIAESRSDLAALERAMQRLPRRHQEVLIELRIDALSRHEVATRHGISLRRVDTMLRQALDFCAEKTDQLAMAGVRSTRRALRG